MGLVIDNDHRGNRKTCAFYDATGLSKIMVEYFERTGGATLYLEWVPMTRPPNFRLMVVVPSSAFVDEPGNSTNSPTSSPTKSQTSYEYTYSFPSTGTNQFV